MSSKKNVRVVIDERERPSGVPEALKRLGVLVEFRFLEVGDYVVSPRCAVERKRVKDFLSSLYSGRLFDQASRLGETYERPVLVVEGDFPEVLSEASSPKALWGALATLAFQFDLTLFFTQSPEQTADLLFELATRESLAKPKGPFVKRKPKSKSLEQLQLSLVSMLPGIGPKLADRALKRFRTVRRVFDASVAELASVDGIGRSKAEKVAKVLDARYKQPSTEPQQLVLDEAKGP